MRTNRIAFLVLIIMGVIFAGSSAGATSVTLDGVENAGWYTDILGPSYLRIVTEGNGTLPISGEAWPLWGSFSGMVSDLSDGYINSDGSNRLVGNYTLYSAGNVFGATPSAPIYKTLSLAAGSYEISLAADSDAYNLLGYSDAAYNTAGANLWNAYVQIWSDAGHSLSFGNGTQTFSSEEGALSFYKDDVISLYLARDTELYLYLNDTNSLDNTGSVTLDIQEKLNPVPVPGALVLLGSGLVGLVLRRRRADA